MGTFQPPDLPRGSRRGSSTLALLRFGFLLLVILALISCDAFRLLDTTPLDRVGMSYDTIKELKALHISQPEIVEIAKVRAAGLSDADCVSLVRMVHMRNRPFAAGDNVAGLYQVGMDEGTVLGLASLDQVGEGAGELQAMHLAGLPDELVLDVARDRAAGKSTLSGEALGTMRNLRMDNSTLLLLVQRGTPEWDGPLIIAERHHGAKDAEILHHFPSASAK